MQQVTSYVNLTVRKRPEESFSDGNTVVLSYKLEKLIQGSVSKNSKGNLFICQ